MFAATRGQDQHAYYIIVAAAIMSYIHIAAGKELHSEVFECTLRPTRKEHFSWKLLAPLGVVGESGSFPGQAHSQPAKQETFIESDHEDALENTFDSHHS